MTAGSDSGRVIWLAFKGDTASVARIEWTRYEGADIEAVVAMLLCRDNPDARRSRPAQGDQGVDVLVPLRDGRFDVHQVKKYAASLDASQKAKIKDSLKALTTAVAAGQLSVRNWYLTMPLDSTAKDDEWFKRLTAGAPFEECRWRGLTFIETLAARFGEVVDYYLFDGKERLATLMSQLMSVLGMRDSAGTHTSVGELEDGLRSLYEAINRVDPHYIYGLDIGPAQDPTQLLYQESVPRCLVFTLQSAQDGVTVSWHVYARCAESTSEREIPLKAKFDITDSPELAAALEAFNTYGTPFEAPLGTVDMQMDLPGGLGGHFTRAALRITPTAEDARATRIVRLRIRDADGTESDEVRVRMNKTSFGLDGAGAWSSGTHEGDVFTIEFLISPDDRCGFTSHLLDYIGLPAAQVLPGLRFLMRMHGRAVELAAEFGPFRHLFDAPASTEIVDDDPFLSAVEALARLQQHTSEIILVPDLMNTTIGQIKRWEQVADEIEGKVVTDKSLGDLTLGSTTILSGVDTTAPSMFSFTTELIVEIGGQQISFGFEQIDCASVTFERSEHVTVRRGPDVFWTRRYTGHSAPDH